MLFLQWKESKLDLHNHFLRDELVASSVHRWTDISLELVVVVGISSKINSKVLFCAGIIVPELLHFLLPHFIESNILLLSEREYMYTTGD